MNAEKYVRLGMNQLFFYHPSSIKTPLPCWCFLFRRHSAGMISVHPRRLWENVRQPPPKVKYHNRRGVDWKNRIKSGYCSQVSWEVWKRDAVPPVCLKAALVLVVRRRFHACYSNRGCRGSRAQQHQRKIERKRLCEDAQRPSHWKNITSAGLN